MGVDCLICQEINALEQVLEQRASDLTQKVNSLCSEVRYRNKKRWERFASWVNLPLIGNTIYKMFKAPRGLESEPDYLGSDWYKPEGLGIEKQARELEQMKANHMEHWGEEKVKAYFPWDYSGYYDDYHPTNPMPRKEAYKTYMVEGAEEKLMVVLPDKYDFSSAAGGDKMDEGRFVMDKKSKKIVPLTQCNWTWTALRGRFARTGTEYRLR